MRISDWSSDVCSSDLTIEQPMLFRWPAVFAKEQLFSIPVWGQAARFYGLIAVNREGGGKAMRAMLAAAKTALAAGRPLVLFAEGTRVPHGCAPPLRAGFAGMYRMLGVPVRSEGHTSELQSLMRISYA